MCLEVLVSTSEATAHTGGGYQQTMNHLVRHGGPESYSIGGPLMLRDGLLQNRIVAKMFSTEHPDWPSSRQILPTFRARSDPRLSIPPTEGSEPGILQQPARRHRWTIDVVSGRAPARIRAGPESQPGLAGLARLMTYQGSASRGP